MLTAMLQGYAANVALLREKVVTAKAQGHPVTALITGANSGIGFALARSLSSEGVRVLLGCRNLARGNDAVAKIKAAVRGADVRLLTIDVSDPGSVLAATERLRSDDSLLGTTKHIDFLFLNAGVMPVAVKRWDVSARAFLTGRIGHFFETGRATPASPHFLQQPPDEAAACGAPSLFATHVLGHALLVEQVAAAGMLNDIAAAPPAAGGAGNVAAAGKQSASRGSAASESKDAASGASLGRASAAAVAADAPGSRLGRVIWTSSRAACGPKLQWQHLEPPAEFGKPSQFQQHWLGGERRRHGETYGEAKHAADLLNAALGRKLPFPCLSICPGAVDSEIMPAFFKPFLFIFKGLRCVPCGWGS
jgi:NAD(P)-dependent dehydrogenase (short-subunit alcohol dehydrogenase family)